MKTLLVFDSHLNPDKICQRFNGSEDIAYLFPLTSKVSIVKTIVEKMQDVGCNAEIIQTAEMINLAADKLRSQYIRFIAKLPEMIKYNGKNLREIFAVDDFATLWWFSLISEKNTFKSNSFNKLAQLDSIVGVVKRNNMGKILFGCKCEKLKNALSEYSSKNSISFEVLRVRQTRGIKRHILEIQNIFYIKHISILLYQALRFCLRAWKIKKKLIGLTRIPANKSLMIITYYPNIDTSLAQRGIFKNKYYSHIQEALQDKKQNITWVAMYVQNSAIPFEEALSYAKRFIKNGYTIFFLDEFASLSIQVKALLTMLKNCISFLKLERAISQAHTFDDYNFYAIFRDDWYSSFFGSTGYSGLLYYQAFKSLLCEIKARKCLYYFEMHAWEKALISAKDAIGSTLPLLAYQHTTVSEMLLNYFNDPDEIYGGGSFAIPKPDKVICNGPLPYNYMKESGWAEEALSVVEAIRYNHIKRIINSSWKNKRKIVVLALSISPQESSSILNITYEALKDMKDIEVWLKPHPFLPLKEVLEMSGIASNNLPPFHVKNGPIEKYLSEARVVIAGESGVSLEALSFNCDVVNINTPEWINMSPLKNIKARMVRSASSAEELQKTIIDIFEEEDCDPKMREIEASKIINDFFYLNYDSGIPEKFMALLMETDIY